MAGQHIYYSDIFHERNWLPQGDSKCKCGGTFIFHPCVNLDENENEIDAYYCNGCGIEYDKYKKVLAEEEVRKNIDHLGVGCFGVGFGFSKL